ncbi:teichoic acid transport system permease protein [Alteribacillus persepolensis]|uniref:Transport permease protein n=1 Tax=Alteribacillus persepolensis TaxID=568899 RepID=A0A1G8EUC1_9BACI|nr:ABC transporter permease [Alteribacillus persepolensis]SDH73407.1 teichoic acid transport system permease protein [Alteribacillus persepolensis]
MKSVVTIIKELWESMYLINRLALYEIKIKHNNNYLGPLWELITPVFFIAIYWFVFGYGIRDNEAVDGVPFFSWMTAGITIWFFVQPAVTQGSKAIYTKVRMVSKMSFPTSVIPAYVVISKLYPHLFLLFIIMIYMQFAGHPVNMYYVQFPYFIFSMIMLVIAFVLISSTITTVIRDAQMFIQSTIRVFLYLTPFLWVTNVLPERIHALMQLNPLYYLVEGYRAAFFGESWYLLEHGWYTLYFWGLVGVLFVIGSVLHVRFRRHFIDFL